MTQKERYDIIDSNIEDRAWSNERRLQIVGKMHRDGIEYTSQEALDQFRDMLCSQLAYMSDDSIPHTREDGWQFIYNNWAIFIRRYYGIIQTWEEYKNTDAYRVARCQLQ